MDADLTELAKRKGLPDALAVLLAEYPREVWQTHPQFDGMVRFWLERHLMFRRLVDLMTSETRKRLDGNMDPMTFKAHVSRLGSMLVGELHMHHNVEDAHYFPILVQKDERLEQGFDILDRDHHAIDGVLNRYVEAANAVIRAESQETAKIGRLLEEITGLERFLDRHLNDEEELIVPIILKFGVDSLG